MLDTERRKLTAFSLQKLPSRGVFLDRISKSFSKDLSNKHKRVTGENFSFNLYSDFARNTDSPTKNETFSFIFITKVGEMSQWTIRGPNHTGAHHFSL